MFIIILYLKLVSFSYFKISIGFIYDSFLCQVFGYKSAIIFFLVLFYLLVNSEIFYLQNQVNTKINNKKKLKINLHRPPARS
jgi:hypothetical protein